MNWDQFYSALRNFLLAIGMLLVSKGWFSADTMSGIVGLIISSIAFVLSQVFHMQTGQSLVAPASGAATPTGPPK